MTITSSEESEAKWEPKVLAVEEISGYGRETTIRASGHKFGVYHLDPNPSSPVFFMNGQPLYKIPKTSIEAPQIFRLEKSGQPEYSSGRLVQLSPSEFAVEFEQW